MAQVPPTGRDPEAPRRRDTERGWAEIPDPALGRQREVQLYRLGGAATDRGGIRRKTRLRLHYHHHRPGGAGPADRRNYQAVHPSGFHRGTRRQFRGPEEVHYRGQEDHRHHRPEVPMDLGRHRKRPPGRELRHHHRRGPLRTGWGRPEER